MSLFAFLLLIYLIPYSTCKYIQCTSHCSQITVSFHQPFNLPFKCGENQENIYEYALICSIDYRIDYDNKKIYIKFDSTNNTNEIFQDFNQTESILQTIWLGLSHEFDQPNITHRSYACSTKNDCARSFYFNTVDYLINNGQQNLNEITLILYNQTKPKHHRCMNTLKSKNRSIVRCSNGLCYAHSHDHKQYCTSDLTPMFFSEIQYQIPASTINRREIIEYKCNKHLCNGNRTMKKVQHLIFSYTNWYLVQSKSSAIQQTLSLFIFVLSFLFHF